MIKTSIMLLVSIITAVLISIFGFKFDGASRVINGEVAAGFIVAPWLLIVLGISSFFILISFIIVMIFPTSAKVLAIPFAVSEGVLAGSLTTIITAYAKAAGLIAAVGTILIFCLVLAFNLSASFRTKTMVVKFFSIFSIVILVISLASIIVYFVKPELFQVATQDKIGLFIFIGISVLYLIFDILMLSFQFFNCEQLVMGGADKKFEWVIAFGIFYAIIETYIDLIKILFYISRIVKKD